MTIETSSWYHTNKTTVWAHTQLGEILIADCTNRSMSMPSQRLNTRLITASPAMMELLEDIKNYLEPDHLNRYAEIRNSVLTGQGD
jgi:hypothetical protein